MRQIAQTFAKFAIEIMALAYLRRATSTEREPYAVPGQTRSCRSRIRLPGRRALLLDRDSFGVLGVRMTA